MVTLTGDGFGKIPETRQPKKALIVPAFKAT
jgi:hypothetical protein